VTWSSLGPTNIGGCTLGVAIDGAGPNRVYALGSSGGCWHLEHTAYSWPFGTRVGTRWMPLTDQLPLLYSTAIGVCRNHPRSLYFATGHYSRGLGFPAQIWRSDDAGANWALPSRQDLGLVFRIAVDPDDPNRIYVASTNGLFASPNGGVAWDELYGGHVVWDVAIDPDDASILYAGVQNVGLIKTTNARPHHRLPMPPFFRTVLPWRNMPNPSVIRIGVGGQGSPDSRLIALKFDNEVRTHASSAEGSGWTSQGSPGGLENLGWPGPWDHVIAVDPFDDAVILAGAQDLYRTDVGGGSWTKVAGYGAATHPDQQQVVFDPLRQGVVYLANDGGVWGSIDSGATWPLDLTRGLEDAELFHVGISGGSAMADMYHEGFIGTTAMQTKEWDVFEGGMPWEWTNLIGDPKRSGRFFVMGDTLGLHRLENWGWPFGTQSSFDPNIGDFTPRSIAFDMRTGSGTIVVGTDDGRLMRALDGGSPKPTWATEPVNGEAGSAINGISFVPGGPKIHFGFRRTWRNGVWAADEYGRLYGKPDINEHIPWEHRGTSAIGMRIMIMGPAPGKPGKVNDFDSVRDLAVDAESSGCVYLLRWNGVEMTPDGGGTWSTINGTAPASLPGQGLLSIFSHPTRGRTLIVASSGGMYVSLDRGQRWHLFGEGLPRAPIAHAFMVDQHLYACTIGRGLWRRDLTGWWSIFGPYRGPMSGESAVSAAHP
jgi:photosystem II stability/assembly factor-like uncharacterized protein